MNLLFLDNTKSTFNVGDSTTAVFTANLERSFNWYDLSIKLSGYLGFEERFVGRTETGAVTKTDPLMGGIV